MATEHLKRGQSEFQCALSVKYSVDFEHVVPKKYVKVPFITFNTSYMFE